MPFKLISHLSWFVIEIEFIFYLFYYIISNSISILIIIIIEPEDVSHVNLATL